MSRESVMVCVYNSVATIERSLQTMKRARCDMRSFSIILGGHPAEDPKDGCTTFGEKTRNAAGQGQYWCCLVAVMLGSVFLRVPGIGWLVVGGPLLPRVVETLKGLVLSGGMTALGSSLFDMGLPEDQVSRCETVVRAGGYLVLVHGSPASIAIANSLDLVLDAHTSAAYLV